MKRKLPQKFLLVLFFFMGCLCTIVHAKEIVTGVPWAKAYLNGTILDITLTDEVHKVSECEYAVNNIYSSRVIAGGVNSYKFPRIDLGTDGVYELIIKMWGNDGERSTTFMVTVSTAPPPVPSYFPVTIPFVEGVTTVPAAGKHSVAYGEPFDLSIEVSDAYDESDITLLVNGVVLDPISLRSASYSYRIEEVYNFIDFEIQGVEKNDPLGINSPSDDSAYSVYTEASRLCVQALKPARLTVYGIDGKVYEQRTIGEGLTQLPLPAGIYIVQIGEESWKVVVN